MKKGIFNVFVVLISYPGFSQDVVIGGVNKNHFLTWNDFAGVPDRGSSFGANTYWNLNYRLEGAGSKHDTVTLSGFVAKLEFDRKLSWVKDGKQTQELLQHEQGHFNIGLICQNEFLRQVNSTIFLRSGLAAKLQYIFTKVLDQYKAMSIQYDEETDHSANTEAQNKWNDFINKELKDRTISFK